MSSLVEICLEDVGGAVLAAAAGADALEVCAGLADGGTTPTLGFVRHCADAAPGLEIRVLVRARPGDFVHSAQEVEVMAADIEATRDALGAAARLGFVIGTLEPDGTIDVAAVRRLVAACADTPVTFHKAFDSVPDKAAGLALLADLGVTRVLTSGGPGPALDHLPELADLVRRGGDAVRIAIGGGVRPANAARIVAETGAPEVHLRAPGTVAPGRGVRGVRRRAPERDERRGPRRGDVGAGSLTGRAGYAPGSPFAERSPTGGSRPVTTRDLLVLLAVQQVQVPAGRRPRSL